MKVYKVVRQAYDGYVSFNSLFAVPYITNEFVYPVLANSKLFCFETYKQALFFKLTWCRDDVDYEIFYAEGEDVKPAELMCGDTVSVPTYWTPTCGNSVLMCKSIPPEGTIYASAIKLIKPVTEEQNV